MAMEPGSTFCVGDVVLVPFPFTDQSTTKKRPAVVVSSEPYNASWPDIVIMAITSRVRMPLSFGEAMIIDWRDAGLLEESVLEPVITTIEQGLVSRRMGKLSGVDAKALDTGMVCAFASALQ